MNSSIVIMVEEHDYIERMLKVVRRASLNVFNGQEADLDDFETIIDFIRNFADKHHHGKEEKFLFDEMKKHLGPVADKLITHGMLVEHDLGRLYMNDAHDAIERVRQGDPDSMLDLVANVMNYSYLLTRHIEKENTVVYPFAEKQLSEEVMDKINADCDKFEEEAEKEDFQKDYIEILEKLEDKYLN